MLSAGEYVVPKDTVQGFTNGGRSSIFGKRKLGSGLDKLGTGIEGITKTVVMAEIAREIGESLNKKDDKPPEFDRQKLSNVGLGSSVNIGRGDTRLSSRFMAHDPIMAEYKTFLLELSDYEAAKTNEKFKKRLSTLATVNSALMSFVTAETVGLLKEPARKLWGWAKGKYKSWFGKADSTAPSVDYDEVLTPGGTGLIDSSPDWMKNAVEKARVDELFGIGKQKKVGGGQRGGVAAMLTAGEGVIPSSIAGRMGYDNLDYMNNTGNVPIIQGPGGVDNVGPVGLDEGDFILRRGSTDKLMRDNPNMMRFALQNPEGFRQASKGYYDGGLVDTGGATGATTGSTGGGNRMNLLSTAETTQSGARAGSQLSETTNNISINVSIDQSGAEVTSEASDGEANYNKEKELSSKIKNAVIEVIRQEKRIGGELS